MCVCVNANVRLCMCVCICVRVLCTFVHGHRAPASYVDGQLQLQEFHLLLQQRHIGLERRQGEEGRDKPLKRIQARGGLARQPTSRASECARPMQIIVLEAVCGPECVFFSM
jgi:hypothetical protein